MNYNKKLCNKATIISETPNSKLNIQATTFRSKALIKLVQISNRFLNL